MQNVGAQSVGMQNTEAQCVGAKSVMAQNVGSKLWGAVCIIKLTAVEVKTILALVYF